MDRKGAIIFQCLYWSCIIESIQREVSDCHNCQSTKWSNKKYGKLPAKVAE